MTSAHEFLTKHPLDLYQLHLLKLVIESGSFTSTARTIGQTQSAVTRQIQSIEQQLGVELFRRTTRTVTATEAGRFLVRESASILGDVDQLLRRLREDYAAAPREVRVGVSRSVSLAYLPGFLAANLREGLPVVSRLKHESGVTILAALEKDELDVGILLSPPRLSERLRVTHRFADTFSLIANVKIADAALAGCAGPSALGQWLATQPWLALSSSTQTAQQMSLWLKRQKLGVRPSMELDNFDLIINLVALGVGVSLVPQRALALYGRRRRVARLPWPERFTRELVVVVRRRPSPPHVQRFVNNILF